MDYYLENLRTGALIALNPDRTLIGNADHVTIRTCETGPFVAALIVNYPSGWVVHGLCDELLYNGKPLRVTQQVVPRAGDVLQVENEQYRFAAVPDSQRDSVPGPGSLPSCFAYIRFPDGMEECRTVDHNLLFGRLRVCHVRYPDTKLSRMHAMLAAHDGVWYVHPLGKGMIARNRRVVSGYAVLEDGDELTIGPLSVRIEMETQRTDSPETVKALIDDVAIDASQETVTGETMSVSSGVGNHAPVPSVTDAPTVETLLPEPPTDVSPGVGAIYASGVRLDQWLKAQRPQTSTAGSGLGGWFDTQRERLKRFWFDTPETAMARALRTSGRPEDAFGVLERALRARPDSPDLLRELFRLYESVGLHELSFRPLRQIEKLAQARGETDTWVLETLARVCERLGASRAGMFDRAVNYWSKLERATGVNYSREKAATMAKRTLCESGFSKISAEDD